MNPTAIDLHERTEEEHKTGSAKPIGPIKKGALHKEMHMSPGKKIGIGRLDKEKAIAKREDNTTLEKRVQFAINFGHHKG